MGKYTEEYKAAIVRRMMPPVSEFVVEISRETGIIHCMLGGNKTELRE